MRRALKPILCLLVLLLSIAPNLSACQLLVSFGLTPHHHGGSSAACVTEHPPKAQRKPKAHRCCGHDHGHHHGHHHGTHKHSHDGHGHDHPPSDSDGSTDQQPCSGDCIDSHEMFFGPATRSTVDVPSSVLPFWNTSEHIRTLATCTNPRGAQRAPPNEARPPGLLIDPAFTGCFLL